MRKSQSGHKFLLVSPSRNLSVSSPFLILKSCAHPGPGTPVTEVNWGKKGHQDGWRWVFKQNRDYRFVEA